MTAEGRGGQDLLAELVASVSASQKVAVVAMRHSRRVRADSVAIRAIAHSTRERARQLCRRPKNPTNRDPGR